MMPNSLFLTVVKLLSVVLLILLIALMVAEQDSLHFHFLFLPLEIGIQGSLESFLYSVMPFFKDAISKIFSSSDSDSPTENVVGREQRVVILSEEGLEFRLLARPVTTGSEIVVERGDEEEGNVVI